MEEKNLRTTSFRQTPLEKKVNCSFVGNWRIFPRSSIYIRTPSGVNVTILVLQIRKPEVIHQPFSQSQNDCVVEKFPADTNFSGIFKTSFKLVSDTYIPNRTFFYIFRFQINFQTFWHLTWRSRAIAPWRRLTTGFSTTWSRWR